MSGSGIRWAICKSAPRSSQIKMPVPHPSVFYRPDALPAAQPTVSKHCRHDRNIPVTTIRTVHEKTTTTIMRRTGECRQDVVDSQKAVIFTGWWHQRPWRQYAGWQCTRVNININIVAQFILIFVLQQILRYRVCGHKHRTWTSFLCLQTLKD